jgi:hypothetical protein
MAGKRLAAPISTTRPANADFEIAALAARLK